MWVRLRIFTSKTQHGGGFGPCPFLESLMIEFQEFPKWLYGQEGVAVVVEDAEQEVAQIAAWNDSVETTDDPDTDAPRKRGRPSKAR